jgi:hypothetical protein
MAQDSANVRVGVTGAVYVAPTGTAAPTNEDSSLNAAFVDLGYVGEDGVTESRDRTVDTIKAWQNGDTVRQVITEATYTLSFTMIETKGSTVELYYGNAPVAGRVVVVPTKTGGRKSFVVDVVDGDEAKRIHIAEGEVTETGEIVYANGEAIGYPVTIVGYATSAITDAAGDNGAAQIWFSSLAS